ncbi:MAG: hypothetical protein MUF42_02540 [Cytophagaceae bacterium]|nr:hypothetical protein [Cytophagaceae bacterium]
MSNFKQVREKWWYRIEHFIGRGGLSMFYALAIVLTITISALLLLRYVLLWIIPDTKLPSEDFWSNAYHIFLEVTDPGTMANFIEMPFWIKITAILAGMCGIVIFSLLVAIITAAVEQMLYRFSQGTTVVHEKNHFLIIGFNSRLIDILKEFALASETERITVVILSEKPKEELDTEIALGLKDVKRLKIITRSGRTTSPTMLERISVDQCRGVIVLSQCENFSDEETKELSDTNVIKICYALSIAINKGLSITVVPELYYESNREVVKSLMHDNVLLVDTTTILSRLLVQTSIFNGLVGVYEQLFSFEGSEIYMMPNPAPGKRFSEIVFHLPDGIPMGYQNSMEGVVLNPPPQLVLKEKDNIILVLSDDSNYRFAPDPIVPINTFPSVSRKSISTLRNILIIGWNSDSESIIREYDKYLSPESKIRILLTEKCEPEEEVFQRLKADTRCSVEIIETENTSTSRLEALQLHSFDMIVLLTAFLNTDQTEVVDSENIKLLLQVKRILNKYPDRPKPLIVSEVLDTSNLELFDHMGLSDFLLSNRLISIFLTQLVVQPSLIKIYDILLAKEGAEINLKPFSNFFAQAGEYRFGDLVSAGFQYHEVVLGYKKILTKPNPLGRSYETILNPDKNMMISLNENDYLIVLSNDNG